MGIVGILKKFTVKSSGGKYIAYLKSKGAEIGDNTAILAPRHTYFDEGRAEFMKIGNGCVICKNTSFIAHDYSWSVLRKKYDVILPTGGKPIRIGSNVFIGEGATVLGGVTIGDNVIIAACSVVTKDIPSDCVAAGNPCRAIMSLEEYKRKREEDMIVSARENAIYLFEKYNRIPNEEKMKNFRVLYMPRTEENNKKYVAENLCIGDAPAEFMNTFKRTEPIYSSYEEFINSMLSERL